MGYHRPFSQVAGGHLRILYRWTETAAILDAQAVTIATKLMEWIIFPHGFPACILSDKGRQFSGEVLQALDTELGIWQIFTSPYHAQTNGLTKRMNKTIKQQHTAFIDPLHTTWDLILPFITHANPWLESALSKHYMGETPSYPSTSRWNYPTKILKPTQWIDGYTCNRSNLSYGWAFTRTYN